MPLTSLAAPTTRGEALGAGSGGDTASRRVGVRANDIPWAPESHRADLSPYFNKTWVREKIKRGRPRLPQISAGAAKLTGRVSVPTTGRGRIPHRGGGRGTGSG